MKPLYVVLIFAILVAGLNVNAIAGEPASLSIGYLEISNDPRYDEKRAYARIRVKPHFRPFAGAKLAIRGSRVLARVLKIKFDLDLARGEAPEDLIAKIKHLYAQNGTRLFVIDANADVLNEIATATQNMEILLFNISARDDILRAASCRTNLLHTIPSAAMLSDALVQYLVFKNWRNALLLAGPDLEDMKFVAAFINSAKRFGVRIKQQRHFIPGNDPRQREQNNIVLLTSDIDVDVIVVGDVEGEFGRYVPYQTQKPRPVIGTEGLQAAAWHWAWERHGAPQLNQRFEKFAQRRMQSQDWAAWVAVKSIVEAVVRTKSTKFQNIRAYLLGRDLTLDGYKGTPSSYRSWDHQLRQPVLLHTYNSVVKRAPLNGFLHPTENMDTLGFDVNDKKCGLKN